MADTNNMIHIAKRKFEQLVRQDTSSVRKAKQGMVREHRPQTHCSRMKNGFMTQAAKACMSMDYLYLLSKDDISEYRKERENRGESGLPVDDEERHMVHLESVGQVSHPSSAFVGMSNDHNLVTTIDEFGR